MRMKEEANKLRMQQEVEQERQRVNHEEAEEERKYNEEIRRKIATVKEKQVAIFSFVCVMLWAILP